MQERIRAMKTPAIVFTDVDRAEVLDIEMPPPGPGEVQVRTHFSTISAGTEGWVFRNRFTWQPTKYPCVPGYQRYGEIDLATARRSRGQRAPGP